jgi:uncharacterized RDD family membrane protein YckC
MTETPVELQPAGLLRRLAALFYDSLLLLACWFVATALLLPFTHGQAVAPHNPLLSTYLLFIAVFFYGWFWTHGGQTLGMRAWKLQLRNLREGPISWWQVLLRVLTAVPSAGLLGLGYLWLLVDKRHLSWHDRYSDTWIVKLQDTPHAR